MGGLVTLDLAYFQLRLTSRRTLGKKDFQAGFSGEGPPPAPARIQYL